MTVIEARKLRKTFGRTVALDNVELRVDAGRIVGLIGPNGAGKSTALNAIVGLIRCDGELEVLGRNPWRDRDELMRDVCFIADVAVLPLWMRTSQLLAYLSAVHPRFDRKRAEFLLAATGVSLDSKVRHLSKGMVAQLHLAIALAVDARLLVLDEPTLGLDPLFRRQFYDALLNDFLERNRTILISTHELEEVQHVLTDVIFLDRGRVALACSVDEIEARFVAVTVRPDRLAAARALHPMHERQKLGRAELIFEGGNREELAKLGELEPVSIPDVFVAVLEKRRSETGSGTR